MRAEVVVADVADVLAAGIEPGAGVFADPARRDARGRVWRAQDFSPDLGSLLALAQEPTGCSGSSSAPRCRTPSCRPDAEAEWVSHHGDVVEVASGAGPAASPGGAARCSPPTAGWSPTPAHLDVRAPGRLRLRARRRGHPGGVPSASSANGWVPVCSPTQIAYLTADAPGRDAVRDRLRRRARAPYDLKVLRRWVREAEVGRLEVKRRGLDVDPAQLRRDLRPRGTGSATLLLSRTPTVRGRARRTTCVRKHVGQPGSA